MFKHIDLYKELNIALENFNFDSEYIKSLKIERFTDEYDLSKYTKSNDVNIEYVNASKIIDIPQLAKHHPLRQCKLSFFNTQYQNTFRMNSIFDLAVLNNKKNNVFIEKMGSNSLEELYSWFENSSGDDDLPTLIYLDDLDSYIVEDNGVHRSLFAKILNVKSSKAKVTPYIKK